MIRPFARSLSLRLLAIFAVTGCVLIAVLAGLFASGLSLQWRRGIQPHLARYVAYLQADLGSPPDPARADAIAAAVPIEIVLYRDGELVHSTGTRPLRPQALRFHPVVPGTRGKVPPGRDARHGGGGDDVGHDGPPWRGERRHGPSATLRALATALDRPVAIARDRGGPVLRVDQGDWSIYYRLDRRGDLRNDRPTLLLAVVAVALVLAASGWWIRRELRPIGRIGAAVERMSDGDLGARAAIRGAGDLAALGGSIDAMAARLQAMLDAKRELLLAVSHELRSPLARARVALALMPESNARERLESDLVEMGGLIDDLLETERLRERHAVLLRRDVDVRSVVAEVLDVLSVRDGIVLDARLGAAPIVATVDAARLRLLTRNLVANATLHGRSADGLARVTVTLSETRERSESRDAFRLEVRDAGPGVDPERLDDIVEPFERLDASRSRVTGGVGLGLTLARLVAEAHGGSMKLANVAAGGFQVVVELPLRPPARTTRTVRPG